MAIVYDIQRLANLIPLILGFMSTLVPGFHGLHVTSCKNVIRIFKNESF